MEYLVIFTVFVPAMTLDPKAVNVDLETSVLFEPKDATSNNSILYRVRSFLNDLQQVLDPDTRFRAQDTRPKITEVLDDLGHAILKFSDDDVASLTKNLYSIVKKVKVDENEEYIRRNLKHTAKSLLKKWIQKEPSEIKASIKSYLENDRGYFVDYVMKKLNSLFDEKDVEKIKIKLNNCMKNNDHKHMAKVLERIIKLFDQQNKKVDDDGDDVITAGRLESKENIDGNDFEGKSGIKRNSKEIILNKNIEVFVRAAE